MTKEYTPQQILALPMGYNDANATTIGDYFIRLAEQAWIEEEGFSGKHPFGNSGWQHEVYTAFATNDLIDHTFYGDDLDDYDSNTAEKMIKDIFKYLRNVDWAKSIEYKEPMDWYVVYLDVDKDGFPTLTDYCKAPLTEKEAKRVAQEMNGDLGGTEWKAIHIPK